MTRGEVRTLDVRNTDRKMFVVGFNMKIHLSSIREVRSCTMASVALNELFMHWWQNREVGIQVMWYSRIVRVNVAQQRIRTRPGHRRNTSGLFNLAGTAAAHVWFGCIPWIGLDDCSMNCTAIYTKLLLGILVIDAYIFLILQFH